MIRFNRGLGQYEFYRLKANFEAHGEPSFQYTDDRQYWEEFIRRWWHHTNLSFETVSPTPEQEARLAEINAWEGIEYWQHDLALYVEHNAIAEGIVFPPLAEKLPNLIHTDAYLEVFRRRLRGTLASHRYKVETGGVTTPTGVELRTDREDQSLLNSAFQTLSQPFVGEIDWKSKSGWVKVDMATIEPLARFVTYHVQSCFSAEKDIDEQLTALTDLEALETLDVKSAFDTAYQARLQAHLATMMGG